MSKRNWQARNRNENAATARTATPVPIVPPAFSGVDAIEPAASISHSYPQFSTFTAFPYGAREIVRNPYNPERAAACAACSVPYGEVGVAGASDRVTSYEMHLDNNDPTGFIRPDWARLVRAADRASWEAFEERERKLDEAERANRENAVAAASLVAA